jgi:hypothetical protein
MGANQEKREGKENFLGIEFLMGKPRGQCTSAKLQKKN